MNDPPDYRFRLNSANNDIYSDLGPRLPEDGENNTYGRIDAI
jgi:hypothetical protein